MPAANKKVRKALEFLIENPDEKPTSVARIYHYKVGAVNTAWSRYRKKQSLPPTTLPKTHGGHNRILSSSQNQAVLDYITESYNDRLGASKQIIFAAITHLRGGKEPSWRWL